MFVQNISWNELICNFLLIFTTLQIIKLESVVGQLRNCDPLSFDGDISCSTSSRGNFASRKTNNCGEPQEPGTIAKYKCKPHFVFHQTSVSNLSFTKNDNLEEEIRCGMNGRWIGFGRFKSLSCREDCGKRLTNPKPLIVNGVPTSVTSWPWHAAIFRRRAGEFHYICGGTVISRSSILTAAHCVTTQTGRRHSPDSTIVVLGAISSNFSENQNRPETQILKVKKFFVSENYDVRKEYQADIGVLHLEKHIEYNDFVSPACLPNDFNADANAIVPGKLGDVIGFGVDSSGKLSRTPNHGSLEIKSHSECFINLQRILTESQFCAGSQRELNKVLRANKPDIRFINILMYQKHSAEFEDNSITGTLIVFSNADAGEKRVTVCNGDSGGGIFHPSIIHEKYYIHGIVSTGELSSKRGVCQNDAVFTRVYSFIFWIRDVLKEISEDVVLELVSNTAYPYVQRSTETRRSVLVPLAPEWKNKVTSIELYNVDVDPEVLLKSLEYSKTVEYINFTQVKLKREFPPRKVQLPLLKSIFLDILREDFRLGNDRTFPITFSKEFFRSLIFFEKEIGDRYSDLGQIVGMKTNFDITVHIFKSIMINHELGKLVLSQIEFTNEILENIPNQDFMLKHLALSRCPLDKSVLPSHPGIENLILDRVVLREKELSELLKSQTQLKEFVFISTKNVTIEFNILPKTLKHLALTRVRLDYTRNPPKPSFSDRKPPSRFPIHSSAIIFPDYRITTNPGPKQSKYRESTPTVPVMTDIETFYCEECFFNENFVPDLSKIFPKLKKLILVRFSSPENFEEELGQFKYLELVFIIPPGTSGMIQQVKKFVKENGKLTKKQIQSNWHSEYINFNYEFNRKSNFWSSEADYIGLSRLSTTEKNAFYSGHYRFNGQRMPFANGSVPVLKNLAEDRFPLVPARVQSRLETIEVVNAEVNKRTIEDSVKFARRLKYLRLMNVSSNDMVQFRYGLTLLPNLQEFFLECYSGDFLLRFGYKGYAIILEHIYQNIFPFRERYSEFAFNKTLLNTSLKKIHLQHANCIEVSWNSVEGSLVSGSSYTNEWLKNSNHKHLKRLAVKYVELETNLVPPMVTHLNLNFVVLKSVGRLLERLAKLKELRLINVRINNDEDNFKEWEWPHLNIADLSLHWKTLEYLALEKVHVRYYRQGIIFEKLEMVYLESCTFEQDLAENFMSIFPRVQKLVILGGEGAISADVILWAALNDNRIKWILSSTSTYKTSAENPKIKVILENAGVNSRDTGFFILERYGGNWFKQKLNDEEIRSVLDDMKGYSDFGNDHKCHAHSFSGLSPVKINSEILRQYLGYLQQKN